LTAITNGEGWSFSFLDWLIGSRFNKNDVLLIFSVGGGDSKKGISTNLIMACQYALSENAQIISVVGKNGGYVGSVSDALILIPVVNNETITPHTEEFGGIILHLLVSHPLLKINQTKWESENEQSHLS